MAVRFLNTSAKLLQSQEERQTSQRCLRAQEIKRLEGMRAGDTILCTNGVLWVTQAGDSADYLLKKGDEFVAHREGLILIQAVDDSACRWYVRYNLSPRR